MSTLLVAATGGHLAQLTRLAPRIPTVDDDSVWVTFDSHQSRSILADRNHVFVPFSGSRDIRTALSNTRLARRIIRGTNPSLVVSTGNAIALSFLPLARSLGIPAAYVESAARADGPSLTGKILRHVPGIQLFSQYSDWASPPWQYAGSVFDEYIVEPRAQPSALLRVFVTLGTIPYCFRRLVGRLLDVLPPSCQVVWQVGATDVSGLDIHAYKTMSSIAVHDEIRRADVVIAHAGVGSALASLDAGKCPILVPRESRYGEHIDDHQVQIARTLQRRSLAVHSSVDALSIDVLTRGAEQSIIRRDVLPALSIAA